MYVRYIPYNSVYISLFIALPLNNLSAFYTGPEAVRHKQIKFLHLCEPELKFNNPHFAVSQNTWWVVLGPDYVDFHFRPWQPNLKFQLQ